LICIMSGLKEALVQTVRIGTLFLLVELALLLTLQWSNPNSPSDKHGFESGRLGFYVAFTTSFVISLVQTALFCISLSLRSQRLPTAIAPTSVISAMLVGFATFGASQWFRIADLTALILIYVLAPISVALVVRYTNFKE